MTAVDFTDADVRSAQMSLSAEDGRGVSLGFDDDASCFTDGILTKGRLGKIA